MFKFRPGTCDYNVYYAVVEANEYQLPRQFAANDIILDVGAHIGSFSLACARRGARRVLAFEAERNNYLIARAHLAEFAGRVEVRHAAVWRSDAAETLLRHSGYSDAGHEINTGGGNVIFQTWNGRQSGPDGGTVFLSGQARDLEVVSVSLDSILSECGRVRLLKLDCEGSEWPILFTSRQLARVDEICGEYHEIGSARNPCPIPEIARVDGFESYSEQALDGFLSRFFSNVKLRRHGESHMGLFWARN